MRTEANSAGTGEFRLALAVWGHAGWVGEFLPRATHARSMLRAYAERMSAVEANTTFYSVPSRETVARWAEETPESFRFFPKLPREVTHEGELAPRVDRALRFAERMRGLGPRLGRILAQLPESHAPDSFDDLRRFLHAWPRELDLALEVRHRAWFDERHAKRLADELERLAVARAILDTREIWRDLHDPALLGLHRKPRLPLVAEAPSRAAFVRYVGHPTLERNDAALLEWAQRVDAWLRSGLEVVFAVHCPVEDQSPRLALRFQALLEGRGAPIPPLPSPPAREHQRDLFA